MAWSTGNSAPSSPAWAASAALTGSLPGSLPGWLPGVGVVDVLEFEGMARERAAPAAATHLTTRIADGKSAAARHLDATRHACAQRSGSELYRHFQSESEVIRKQSANGRRT